MKVKPVDNVFGADWSTAQYLGDGVYMRDFTDITGIASVALRVDRHQETDKEHHCIVVIEDSMWEDMARAGKAILVRQANLREFLGKKP